MWTFSWLFSFAAVTGPMHSGASALLFLDENPAVNSNSISSQKSRWAYFLWFALLKSYNTKCRHSLCWSSQNTRRCTSMLWLRRGQHHISCALGHDDLHHSWICCAIECFEDDLFGLHYDAIACLFQEQLLGLNLYWQVLQFYCLAKQWPPSLSCHPCMIFKYHW